MEISAIPGQRIQVSAGDTVDVTVQFEYRGPAYPTPGATPPGLYLAIGKRAAIFNEVLFTDPPLPFTVPKCDAFTIFSQLISIPITAKLGAGIYDMYCKIINIPGADIISPDVIGCIEMVAAVEFRSLRVVEFRKA